MSRIKKEYPKIYIAKGREYTLRMDAVDSEGKSIHIKNPDGTNTMDIDSYGVYVPKCMKMQINMSFYKKLSNHENYCFIIVEEPKNAREKYIADEIEKRHKKGIFMTKEEFEIMLNPERAVSIKLEEEKNDLANENSMLQKQYKEIAEKLAKYEPKQKA